MFRFYGGQVVKRELTGICLSGESIELEHEKILPGRQESIMLVGLQFQQEAIIP